ncbi:MAG: glycosyltransferase [Coriobacteriia bacterium]|nr:glycosyltransferase [Coriobacteriia bacterium]
MEPLIIIPTFWTRPKSKRGRSHTAALDDLTSVYDHPTPIDAESTLGDCLRSLEQVEGLGRVLIIAAATDETIEHRAEDRVREIVDDFPDINAFVFGPAELGSLHRRLEQLEFADMIDGVRLRGYGAVRNVGLMAAAVLGYEAVVFLDDDEVVTSPDFLKKAMYGLGARFDDGRALLAKSGFYTDTNGRWQQVGETHWSDMFWRQRDAFNETMAVMMRSPRIQHATLAFGGCLALHRDMFVSVSFDPWVLRGEDADYVINARMHGGGVYLDNEWSVVHMPPEPVSESVRFSQDVYRFIYEQRKIEFAKSQVDLRQVTARSLSPYPGDFIHSSIGRRATLTAFLRVLRGGRDYFNAGLRVAPNAGKYAQENCQNYFEFQRRWPILMAGLWDDIALKSLFSGERRVDRTAITGRFPVVPT